MIGKEEIILMTKLALHEKKYGKQDKERGSYFKWDYIYINNWYTRFAVGVATAIVASWMVFKDVYMREIIPVFEVDLGDYLYKYILGFLALILVYSGISTLVHNRKYEKTQRRIEAYESMIEELDALQNLKELRGENLHDAI